MPKSNEISELIDYQTKKSVHINLTKSTHGELRVILLRMGLSMQEVFEDFAQRVVSGDGFAHRVLETIERRKRNKEIEKLSETDVESLFDAIEDKQSYEG